MTRVMFIASALLFVVTAACTIDDEDRCPDGYHYDPVGLACKLCGEDQTWNPTIYECEDPPPPDGGTDTDTEQSGLGEPCASNIDCQDYVAAICAIDPLTNEGKYCTIENCTPADCTDGFQCCDCTASSIEAIQGIACAKDEDATQLVAMAGCTCS